MKLTAETVLDGVAQALKEQISPLLDDGFAREAARMAQSLIAIVARGMDDAAAIRVSENAVIRELLGEGAGLAPAGQRDRLHAAARSADPGLRISELDAENGRLRALLVELHAWLESEPSAPARALDQRIWRELAAFEASRAPRA